ncbi:MAG: YbaB/EbfC family nucleoid-associated protein [Alphaproteobacteria bacterium]|nr:YbaB/EbfC family nucleoid-associated protein [Alphaproteobacteria bacterium]
MNNMNQLLAQAQKLQANVTKAQNDIKDKEVTGASGSGAIEITLTVSGKMKSIVIDKKIVDPEDTEMLEDLIITAFNNAKTKADAIYEEEIKKATGGMHLPGLF